MKRRMITTKVWCLIVLIGCTLSAKVKADEIQYLDSLNEIISSNTADTSRIQAAINKAEYLEYSNFNEAKNSALWALELSKSTDYQMGIVKSWYALASMHYESQQPEMMIAYVDSVLAKTDLGLSDEFMADTYNLLGIANYIKNDLINAIVAWEKAITLYDEKDQSGVISNIGNIYLSSDEKEKAIDYFLKAAEINKKTENYRFLTINYMNIANCYQIEDTTNLFYVNKAEEYARKANYSRVILPIYDGKHKYYASRDLFLEATIALDSVYVMSKKEGEPSFNYYYKNALGYYRYKLAYYKKEHNDKLKEGTLEIERSSADLMLEAARFFETKLTAEKSLPRLMDEYRILAYMYKDLENYKAAAESYEKSLQYKDSVATNKAQFILKEFERKQKAAQEREAALRAKNEKQRQQVKFYSAISGAGLFILLAFGLWSRLRYVRKSKAELQKEKDISEGLLLNILPEETANELKAKGYTDAKEFEHATILFTDFKGFTSMSERMSAAELVDELNVCFKGFDHIMEKYGIEKIKTIGDAYMAAGGLHMPRKAEAEDVVKASLEMQEFMTNRKMQHDELGIPSFEMRVGIHTGPVIAGVVGIKKFQYDIWGDTVNTASRMESSGEIGKVNISEATYEIIKDMPAGKVGDPVFAFESRGKIEAKGKGLLKMFFVAPSKASAKEN
jgi:adenylate cyclase